MNVNEQRIDGAAGYFFMQPPTENGTSRQVTTATHTSTTHPCSDITSSSESTDYQPVTTAENAMELIKKEPFVQNTMSHASIEDQVHLLQYIYGGTKRKSVHEAHYEGLRESLKNTCGADVTHDINRALLGVLTRNFAYAPFGQKLANSVNTVQHALEVDARQADQQLMRDLLGKCLTPAAAEAERLSLLPKKLDTFDSIWAKVLTAALVNLNAEYERGADNSGELGYGNILTVKGVLAKVHHGLKNEKIESPASVALEWLTRHMDQMHEKGQFSPDTRAWLLKTIDGWKLD